ncbi:HAD family phosphatase [Paenalkalicoccus suaedae]|uniref:HAD family phosphatase n=1 Tax=Paenalkalicoccus suaedae TaxID=2592382 RepID=A0A859FD47_9BACI|nr:Cof-type HAD-IIB family hydrolase [Paenalkalicoccus suaedae]QKS71283.1 HAD family phosphatase [Paenalkalicoccus suaedae]
MTNVKLLALDMDGTTLTTSHLVDEETKQAIKQAKDAGIEIVISTGRSFQNVKKYAEELELTNFLIASNGGEIWQLDGTLVERTILPTEHVETFLALASKHNVRFWAAAVDKVWRHEAPEDIYQSEWLKFGYDLDTVDERKLLLKELESVEGLELTNSSLVNIEINAAGVHKAAALKTICEKLSISMENVLAIGDSLNDVAMIKEAGIGIAMGNAQDSVKEIADDVTTSNDEQGVANAIKKYVL